MNRLLLYGGFDWLESPMLIGTLGYESLRGSDSYSYFYPLIASGKAAFGMSGLQHVFIA